MNLQNVRNSFAQFGVQATVHDLAYRAANKVADLLILKAMTLTPSSINESAVTGGDDYSWGFATASDLESAMAEADATKLDWAFVEAALKKGDRCYAAFRDGRIASYGWYSTRPTEVNEDLTLHFDPSYVYMYKGYTLPDHRGKRLHGIGMARAMRALNAEGKSGLISYVESRNFSSLRSCYRLGYRDIGQIFAIGVGDQHLIFASTECETYGLRLVTREASKRLRQQPVAAVETARRLARTAA